MNFVSWAFAILFAAVFACRLTLGRRKTEGPLIALVMLASMIFVVWHVPVYVFIMLASIAVDYLAGIGIGRCAAGSRWRKALLGMSIVANLSLLGFFKYANFAMESLERGLGALHIGATLPHWDFILPMGISFYTFCSMSYTIDVYRGVIAPVRRFGHFYFFVTFFPHLVAGPIIRADEFFYQLPRRRQLRLRVFNAGVFLIIRGLFLKMVCADNLSGVVDAYWSSGCVPGASSLSMVALAAMFGTQVFCDFAGYSSIARGLAYLLGFRFPINFNCPFIAGSFKDFWQRWHITLSRWLRDYLYISLGGSRVSVGRTYVNVMLVMVLGGLWHGAALTFIIWGALHGAALAGERLLGMDKLEKTKGRVGLKLGWYLVVQGVVLVTMVVFRSEAIGDAATFLGNMAAFRLEVPARPVLLGLLYVLPVAAMHGHQFLVEQKVIKPVSVTGKAVLAGVMLYATLALYGASSDFIYFQF